MNALCRTVLIVAGEADDAAAAAIGRIASGLRAEGYALLRATTARDGAAQLRENLAIGCLLLDRDLGEPGAQLSRRARAHPRGARAQR